MPALAVKVRRMGFGHWTRVDDVEHAELLKASRRSSGEANGRECRSAKARLRQVDRGFDDLNFFETSSCDGIMLADALSRLPNVKDIDIHPSSRGPVGRICAGHCVTLIHP